MSNVPNQMQMPSASPVPPEPMPPQMPNLSRQAWNLARSLADFVADGCKTVSKDMYRHGRKPARPAISAAITAAPAVGAFCRSIAGSRVYLSGGQVALRRPRDALDFRPFRFFADYDPSIGLRRISMTVKCPNEFPVSFNNPCQCPSGAVLLSRPSLCESGCPSGLSSGTLRFLPRQKSNTGAEGVSASSDYGFGYNWMSDDSLYICPRCNPSDPLRIVLGGRIVELNWDSTAGKYSGQGLEGVFASNDGRIRVGPTGPAAARCKMAASSTSLTTKPPPRAASRDSWRPATPTIPSKRQATPRPGIPPSCATPPTIRRRPPTSCTATRMSTPPAPTATSGSSPPRTPVRWAPAAAEDIQSLVQFAYHGGGSSSGSVGDLKTITVQEKQDGSWVNGPPGLPITATTPIPRSFTRSTMWCPPMPTPGWPTRSGIPLAASDAHRGAVRRGLPVRLSRPAHEHHSAGRTSYHLQLQHKRLRVRRRITTSTHSRPSKPGPMAPRSPRTRTSTISRS